MLKERDPEIAQALDREIDRQRGNIVLIASENYASGPVLEMLGSPLTNKYAEGYPGKRYYGGCQFVDIGEQLAIDRAKELYGAEHANVQPHSGAQANMAAYFALLKPGDTVLGMRLDQGGHLTHGSPVNFSGVLYNFVSYGVDRESELLDYDEIERLAKEHRPTLIVAGATAYPRTIDFARFRAIADAVDARLMVDMAHPAGIIAAGLHPSPTPHADVVTSSTHKTLRGPRGGMILSNAKFKGAVDKAVFPRLQGGPLMHVIAAKAVAFGEALRPDFRDYQQAVLDNAKALSAGPARARLPHCERRDRQPPDARRPNAVGSDRPGGRDAAGIGAHHGEQERDPLRHAAASGHQRPAARHASSHHARLRDRGDAEDRGVDRSGHRGPRRRGGPRGGPRRSTGARKQFPPARHRRRRVVRSARAQQVQNPASDGEVGCLPLHAPML